MRNSSLGISLWSKFPFSQIHQIMILITSREFRQKCLVHIFKKKMSTRQILKFVIFLDSFQNFFIFWCYFLWHIIFKKKKKKKSLTYMASRLLEMINWAPHLAPPWPRWECPPSHRPQRCRSAAPHRCSPLPHWPHALSSICKIQ